MLIFIILWVDISGPISKFHEVTSRYIFDLIGLNELERAKRLYRMTLKANVFSDFKDLGIFRFYNDLLSICVNISKNYGAPFGSSLNTVKASLIKEIEFTRKERDFTQQANLQFLLMSIISWGFAIFASQMFELELSISSVVLILLWQVCGVVSFNFITNKISGKRERTYSVIFKNFITYRSLLSVSLPILEVKKNCQFSELSKLKGDELDFFIDRFFTLISLREKNGRKIKDDIDALIDDTRFYYEEVLTKSLSRLNILKFCWLVIFYLLSYLALIYSTVLRMI